MTTPTDRVRARASRWAVLVTVWLGWAVGCQDDRLVNPPESATTGRLLVTLITTGGNQDPDGFDLIVDHGTPIEVSPSTELTLTLTPGSHTIELADLAANCAVSGGNPRIVSIAATGSSAVTFQVSCPFAGSMRISTTTSGTNPDLDGYLLTVDGAPLGHLGPQEVREIGALHPRIYLVRLSLVAGNCSIQHNASRYVNVSENNTENVIFAVTCIPRIDDAPGEKLVLAVRSIGEDDHNLYFMESNGTGTQRLTDYLGEELSPEISPDGTRILFLQFKDGNRSLKVLDRVSRTETVLPTAGVDRAIWSPDGNSIAFIRTGRLFRMSANGTGEIPLTTGTEDAAPYWSPDGTRIVFTRGKNAYMINADGSGLRNISNDRLSGPWSPDGRSILLTKVEESCVYWYCYYYGPSVTLTDLVILDVETGLERMLTDSPLQTEWSPVWALDGQRVYFLAAQHGNPDVHVIGLNGGPAVNLSASIATESWITIGRVH